MAPGFIKTSLDRASEGLAMLAQLGRTTGGRIIKKVRGDPKPTRLPVPASTRVLRPREKKTDIDVAPVPSQAPQQTHPPVPPTPSRIPMLKRRPRTLNPDLLKFVLENETYYQHVKPKRPPRSTRSASSKSSSTKSEPDHAPSSSTGLKITDFKLEKMLGEGQWGQVFLSRHIASKYICAIKIIKKKSITRAKSECLLRRELEIHQSIVHPSILKFLGWFHDARNVYLVLEYAAGGDLFGALRSSPDGRFDETRAAQYIAQTAQALQYLHERNIMHRDLKPENILLGLQGEIKLADFGYSIHSPSNLRQSSVGTPVYMPPEIAAAFTSKDAKQEPYSNKVDNWSLGVLAYELVVGKPPFQDKNKKERDRKIAGFKGDIYFPLHVSVECRMFVKRLLVRDPNERMSLEDVLKHVWITSAIKAQE